MPITKDTNRYAKVKQLTDADLLGGLGSAASSESFGINYIDNFDAETDTTGWATYADAVADAPENGSGGSPNVTFTRVQSPNLRGTAHFRFTKDAVDRRGQGFSYDFSIAEADKAKPLFISFEYAPSSGFVAGNSSDLRVWIYDVTNNQLIQPAPYTIHGGSGSNHKFIGTFQTSSNSTSYRLIFHIATISSVAWTFDLDTVIVGPQTASYGAVITDWKEYPLTITGSTTNPTKGTIHTDKALWRRVGDSMEITYAYRQTTAGTAGNGSYRFSIPAGHTIDLTNKIFALGADNSPVIGHGAVGTNPVAVDRAVGVFVPTATTLGLYLLDSPKDVVGAGNESLALAATQKYTFFARVPIVGWSSTVEMSNDTDTRVVAMSMNNITPSGTINSSYNDITWPAPTLDTHGSMSGSTYTVPVSGIYVMSAYIRVDGTDGLNGFVSIQFLKNGAVVSTKDTPPVVDANMQVWDVGHTAAFKCNAGDTIKVQMKANIAAGSYVPGNNSFMIHRLSGPSAIAASETVAARYKATMGISIPTGTGPFRLDFDTKDFDSHGAVSGAGSGISGTWQFAAPVSGTYEISATIRMANGSAWAANSYLGLQLYKNGIAYAIDDWATQTAFTNSAAGPRAHIFTTVKLLAGETIDLRGHHGEGGSRALLALGSHSYVDIKRVGNY